MQVSKRDRRKVETSGASVYITESMDFLLLGGLAPMTHLKFVLRGTTRIFRDSDLKIVLTCELWMGHMQHVCKHHADCAHGHGHLLDLMELRTLVDACPHFTCRPSARSRTCRERADSHFVLVTQSMNADLCQVHVVVGEGAGTLHEEPYVI